jgi:hypothetical protein
VQFSELCRQVGLLATASVAIDGSKFKALNNRDKNFTRAKMERRMAQIEESVVRYLQQLDTADRQEPSEALKTKTSRLKEKIEKLTAGWPWRPRAEIPASIVSANPDNNWQYVYFEEEPGRRGGQAAHQR